jgi:hydroxyquinol 1,2-dioxygenase
MSAPSGRRALPHEITDQALASFAEGQDERLRTIMQSIVKHLHAFVSEVMLTEAEWAKGIAALTATGEVTDEKRQEFILWSDVLGVSMLVDALAHDAPDGATESTVLGPFYVQGSPVRPLGASIAEQGAGTPTRVSGRVLDLSGSPIAGAELDIWQNGDNQLYAVQDENAPDDHLRGKFRTGEDGRYCFYAVRPVPYPVPDDGPVGHMLEAAGRHPWRPAHIHMVVRADGYRPVTTHIFDAASPYLENDAVFAVKPSLVYSFLERAAGDPGHPPGTQGPWADLELDLVLAAGDNADVLDLGRTH